jgi:arginase
MASRAYRSITIISSPYHVGISGQAVARGPTFLKSRGIVDEIQKRKVLVQQVEIPSVEHSFDGEIGRSFELFRRLATSVRQAHESHSFPLVLADNCSASVGVASGLQSLRTQLDSNLSCVWFDAHDDFNTPDSLLSGYFDSMPIAMLGGLCWKTLLGTVPGYSPIDLRRLIQVGMRDVTDLERKRVEEAQLSVVWAGTDNKIDFQQGLTDYLSQKELGLSPNLVHVDLDCLDTSIGRANKFAAPGGLLREDLVGCLKQTVSKTFPAAMTIASFDPSFEGAENIADVAIEATGAFVDALQTKGLLARDS